MFFSAYTSNAHALAYDPFDDSSVPYLPENLPESSVHIRPDSFGGYEIYDYGKQKRSEVRSDGLDGFNYYDSGNGDLQGGKMHQIRPDGFGGYDIR